MVNEKGVSEWKFYIGFSIGLHQFFYVSSRLHFQSRSSGLFSVIFELNVDRDFRVIFQRCQFSNVFNPLQNHSVRLKNKIKVRRTALRPIETRTRYTKEKINSVKKIKPKI